MTDDDKALVERLQSLHVWPQIVADYHATVLTPKQIDKLYEVGSVSHEAADRIEALSAENERLREALQSVTPPPHFGESEQNKTWWAKARAALGGGNEMTDLDPDAQMMARHNDALAVERLINAARDKAKMEERAAIVAWLRKLSGYDSTTPTFQDRRLAHQLAALEFSSAIEAGEHLK